MDNRNMIFKAGEGAGKSGCFFFFSHDNRFLIKTLRGSEKEILLNILPDYVNHIKNSNNKSLLVRIYGLYTLKSSLFGPIEIILMQNTAIFKDKQNSKLSFDLKGSTIGRYKKLSKK